MTVRMECPHCGGAVRVQVAAVRDDQACAAALAEHVAHVVTEHGPISGRDVRARLRRRRADVRDALLNLEAVGRIHRDDDGRWTR